MLGIRNGIGIGSGIGIGGFRRGRVRAERVRAEGVDLAPQGAEISVDKKYATISPMNWRECRLGREQSEK